MSERPEDNIVAGLSMGGYGALKCALTHPGRFGMCASLSGSLDIAALERMGLLPEWRCIFDHNMQSPAELKGTCHDLFYLADQLKEQGTAFPKTFIWCGTEDWLLDSNNRFSAHLQSLGVPHKYETSEGNHSWKYWDMHIQSALAYLLG
jgi:S-formylglutathione hydrolase FrmB